MGYKMKGSPAKMGNIQGTAAHSSALKMKVEQNAASALKQGDESMSANELVAIRKDLKEKKDKLAKRKEEGKITILGKRRRRKTQEKIEENQALINKSAEAQKWKKDAEDKGKFIKKKDEMTEEERAFEKGKGAAEMLQKLGEHRKKTGKKILGTKVQKERIR
jgi:hypothetical protein